jgi:hypothetical protein
MPGSNSGTQGRFCDGLGNNIMVQYSAGPIITLHGRISAREYVDWLGNQMHPMIQMLFQNNNNIVFQDDSTPIYVAGTIQSWFEEHKGKLQHLTKPAASPNSNIIEPLQSIPRRLWLY